jgi:shikimate dehydrogenase
MINGATSLVGIIGDPVSHSLSPAMHNAAFAALGLDMAYVPLRVVAADVGAAVQGLRALSFRGANVTVPHKTAVAPFLDSLQDDAALLGAVNTIVVDGGSLRGHNTDVEGVRRALWEACGDGLRGQSALLLGAGGAGRAVALALARLEMRLTIVNRSREAAEALAALISGAVAGATCEVADWQALGGDLVAVQRLLVNATALGMRGAGKVPSALADNGCAGQVAFDAVYASGGTDFLARARQRGAVTVDGLEMLLWQAAAAFELWTGHPAPLKVMRDAATYD